MYNFCFTAISPQNKRAEDSDTEAETEIQVPKASSTPDIIRRSADISQGWLFLVIVNLET